MAENIMLNSVEASTQPCLTPFVTGNGSENSYKKTKLVATLKKFYGRHHDLVNPYNVAVSRIVSDVFASDAP